MGNEFQGERHSWAAATGMMLLSLASFVGCVPKEDPPVSEIVAGTVLEPLVRRREGGERDIAPVARDLLQQTIELERYTQIIRKYSDRDGWKGSEELRIAIIESFNDTGRSCLRALNDVSDPFERQAIGRLYESIRVTGGLFRDNALGTSGIEWGDTATDGSMSHLYGLEAQLILFRLEMTRGAESIESEAR
jgi:hypothetical protein